MLEIGQFPSDIRHYLIRHLQYEFFFYKIDHQSGSRNYFTKIADDERLPSLEKHPKKVVLVK